MVHALTPEPDLIRACFANSPALWRDDNAQKATPVALQWIAREQSASTRHGAGAAALAADQEPGAP